MNNSFSRPSLGINQSALFNASNEMAQNASLRQKCINQPQRFLGKYGISISDKPIEAAQQTSEIGCLPSFWCITFAVFMGVAAVFVVFGAVTAGVAAGGVLTVGSCWTEFSGCSIEHPMLIDKYKGIC
jgi:hypothetical protein